MSLELGELGELSEEDGEIGELGELGEEDGEIGELGELSPSPKYTYTANELFERRRQMEQVTSGELPLPAAVNPAWVGRCRLTLG